MCYTVRMALRDSPPVDHWRLRTRTLAVGRLPLLMGIINVTPDSFSDGGNFFDADAAIAHGLQLIADGADILDVGGESTRPFSEPVEVQEELRRVMPVVGALCKQTATPISIDTSKALVARHAVHAGAEIINDITALSGDPGMLPLAVETGCGVCAMHMQGAPRTMQEAPTYADVVGEVMQYLQARRDVLRAAGSPAERIALDPGIGFGKNVAHNLKLLANIGQLHALGCPLLVGHSRKRFLTALAEPSATLGAPADLPAGAIAGSSSSAGSGSGSPDSSAIGTAQSQEAMLSTVPLSVPSGVPTAKPSRPPHVAIDRTAGTIAVALALARQGVQVLRVHDVAAVRQALLAFAAVGGLG
jgi:dihydropteroate synthase